MLVYGAMVNQKMVGAMSILKKKLKISKKGKGKAVVVEGSGELHYFTLTTILLLQTIFLRIISLDKEILAKRLSTKPGQDLASAAPDVRCVESVHQDQHFCLIVCRI